MTLEALFALVDQTLAQDGFDGLLREAPFLFIAYSGGADSTFLLTYVAQRFSKERVRALHFNHQIRGAEALRDQQFCEAYCRTLGVPLLVESENVPALAEASGESLETAARDARYRFFEDQLQKNGGFVLTAHTADDQLETVLFHLLRGAGTKGMSGIPKQREGFVRPLLEISGTAIRDALNASGIAYVTDSTNADAHYTRNYLRQVVVPALRAVVPEPEKAASRLATLCRNDNECLESLAREALAPYWKEKRIPADVLAGLHPALSSRVLLLLHEASCPEAPSVSMEQVDAMMALVRNKVGTKRLSLPGKVMFELSGGQVAFCKDVGDVSPECVKIVPGEAVSFGVYRVSLCEGFAKSDRNYPEASLQMGLKFATISEHLTLRPAKPGDVCRLFGMTKQVKKLFSAKKYTAQERKNLPLLWCGDTIAWVPGYPPCDGFRSGEVSLEITVNRKES